MCELANGGHKVLVHGMIADLALPPPPTFLLFPSPLPLLSSSFPSLLPSLLSRTDMASGLPADQLAVSREDFLPATGSIAMGDGETSTSINITILHVSYVCV